MVVLGPLAEAAEQPERDRAFAQHPLAAEIDHAVADPPLGDRRGGVGELDLAGLEVLVVEGAAVDATHAHRRASDRGPARCG
jgi:hypothetical protein